MDLEEEDALVAHDEGDVVLALHRQQVAFAGEDGLPFVLHGKTGQTLVEYTWNGTIANLMSTEQPAFLPFNPRVSVASSEMATTYRNYFAKDSNVFISIRMGHKVQKNLKNLKIYQIRYQPPPCLRTINIQNNKIK